MKSKNEKVDYQSVNSPFSQENSKARGDAGLFVWITCLETPMC